MKSVTITLLLCLCIVVTSHAQIGIHISSNGDVGIGDETPYTRLTLSGPIGLIDEDFPALFLYESEYEHVPRQVLAHSPQLPDLGLRYDPSRNSFWFGNAARGVAINTSDPAIGIGTSDPINALVIAGVSQSKPAILRLGNTGGFDQENSGTIIFDEDIGVAYANDNFCGVAVRYNGASNQLEYLGDCTEGTNLGNASLLMGLSREGNLGIGVQPDSAYRLQIAGDMRAQEIVVESGWADYVFTHDYRLKPLDEVEGFIVAHQHLPGIPSAKEIQNDGLEVAEMSRLMMEKIEELTLYTIDQQKTITEQQQVIEQLIAETTKLRNDIDALKRD